MNTSAAAALRDAMRAAAADPVTAERLAMVDGTVLVLERGDEHVDVGVWLDFTGERLEVGDPPAGAEPDITLWMDPELLEQFPFFHFSMAMAEGRMTCEGPVKELLAVNPVLRTAVENGRLLTGSRP